jgi:hypothetical protein
MANIYTVTCDYAASGEGRTLMLLITRGHGPNDGATNALERFKGIFGSYYAQGATVEEGLQLCKHWIPWMITGETRKNLMSWQDSANLEYFSSLHVNLS